MSTPTHDDGGPAFPFAPNDHSTDWRQHGNDGMSLRDWFAGRATEKDIEQYRWRYSAAGKISIDLTREESKYAYASAMIAARKESQP